MTIWGEGVLFLIDFIDALYVLDTSLLADYTYYVYLPHSASLFSLLISSDDQKFLILMSTTLSVSPFIVSAFGVFFKKCTATSKL